MTAEYALPDRDIVARVLAGSREDFGVLVERYLSMARAVAFAHTGNQADAEDVTQEAFLQAFKSLGALRDRVKFPAWLAGIARHLASRVQAQRQRQTRLIAQARPETMAVAPDLAQAELQALVRQRILELDEKSCEVLLLHYFAGMTIAHAAEVMGVSPEAAAKRLQRAREALGHKLLAEVVPALAPREAPEEKKRGIMALVLAAPVSAAPRKSWTRQATPWVAAMLKSNGRLVLILLIGLLAVLVSVYWMASERNAAPVAPPKAPAAAPAPTPKAIPEIVPPKGAASPKKGPAAMPGK